MTNYHSILLSLGRRLLVALPFLGFGVLLLFRAGGGWGAGAAQGLFGSAMILIAAVILAFPLARLLAEPVGSLFYPSGKFDRPQPMYSIPAGKRKKTLYEEAIADYEKIAADHPGEVKPYIEIIDITVTDLHDKARARRVYEAGIGALADEDARGRLHEMFEAISSQKSAEEKGERHTIPMDEQRRPT